MLKKTIACMVVLCLGLAALSCPASAAKNNVPIVFVHGLAGWGEGTKLNELLPYWGLYAGDIIAYLKNQGYEAYAASVAPVSSAWDRACELYAHLTGTRTDYGEAHSKEHGHGRFGPAYAPLGPDWPKEPIHLVGHSFGGATIRLFAQLCAEGCAQERAVTSEHELSPLFSGSLGGHIVSITTLAAPHNGTTALLPSSKGANVDFIEVMLYSMAALNAFVPGFAEFYPYHMQHFGVSGGTSLAEIIEYFKEFDQSIDSSQHDLSVDGAREVNKGIRCQPDIYYFSYASDMTRRHFSGGLVPRAGIHALLVDSSLRMGQKFEPFATPGGTAIDRSWLPNDGLVNTVSALYPFDEPHRTCRPKNIRPGVWQVMPVIKGWDHLDFAGGLKVGGTEGVMEFYLNLAQTLYKI